MQRMTLLIALLLLAMPALSGCIGPFAQEGDEDLAPDEEEDAPDDEQEDDERNETREDETRGNETREADDDDDEPKWQHENRTGTVSGTNALVTSSGLETETFTVEEDTLELKLNLTADGGELAVCIREPDTEEGECTEETTTENGGMEYSTQQPTPGEWGIEMEPADPGSHSIDYELGIGTLVPTERA